MTTDSDIRRWDAAAFDVLQNTNLYPLLWNRRVGAYLWSPLIVHEGPWTYVNVPAHFLRATAYPIQRKMNVDRIGIRVAGAGAAGARIRMGVYEDDGNCYPSKLILDAGELDATTVGDKALAIDLTLEKGLYWVVFNTNDPGIDLLRPGFQLMLMGGDMAYMFSGWRIAMAYGPLPKNFPAGAEMDIIFCVCLRIAKYLE